MDEAYFTSLVRGELPPKIDTHCVNATQQPISTTPIIPSLPPNQTLARVVELKRPDPGSTSGTDHGVMMIEDGPHAGHKAFFNRTTLWCFGHHMAKADLMYLISETDRFRVEVQGGTNNKSVPFKIVSAWIGPQPSDKNKEAAADMRNPAFAKW